MPREKRATAPACRDGNQCIDRRVMCVCVYVCMCVGEGSYPSASEELRPGEGPLELIHNQVRHPPDVAPAALTQTHQADLLIAPNQPTVACNDASSHTHTHPSHVRLSSDHPLPSPIHPSIHPSIMSTSLTDSPRAVVLGISLSSVTLLVSIRSFDGGFMSTPASLELMSRWAAIKSRRLDLDVHGCLTSMQDWGEGEGEEGEGEAVERNADDDSWSSSRAMSRSKMGRGEGCLATGPGLAHVDLPSSVRLLCRFLLNASSSQEPQAQGT